VGCAPGRIAGTQSGSRCCIDDSHRVRVHEPELILRTADRSRRFCIQIEGRFKKPWNGNEVLFGVSSCVSPSMPTMLTCAPQTDFEYLPKEFPRAPFNAGMRIAKMIDPCTFCE
jgi:hypothetical protein